MLVLLLLGINSYLTIVGALQIGTSWGEPEHQVERTVNFLERGVSARDEYFDQSSGLKRAVTSVYGPVFNLVGHGTAVLFGVETWGAPELTLESVQVRHLLLAVLGLVAAASVSLVLVMYTQRAWPAALGAAALMSYPIWSGHSMFSSRDIPVAVGWTLVTCGLALLSLSERGRYGISRYRILLGLACILVLTGGILSVGVRPAMLLPITASFLAFLAFQGSKYFFSSSGEVERRTLRQHVVLAAGAFGLVLILLALLAPLQFGSPDVLMSAVRDSSAFPWPGRVFMLGENYSMPPPWWYVPVWLIVQAPDYLTIVAIPVLLVGAVTVFQRLMSRGSAGERLGLAGRDLLSTPLLFLIQTLMVPVFSAFSGASLYDGMRHLLFVFPGIAFFLALGLWIARRRYASLGAGLVIVSMSGISITTVSNMLMHPYQYASFSASASLSGIDNRWHVDLLRTSGRELLTLVPEEGPIAFRVIQEGAWFADASQNDSFTPYLHLRGSRLESPERPLKEREYWLLNYNRHGTVLPSECELVSEITRQNYFAVSTIGQVARCVLPPAVAPPWQ